MSQNTHSSHAQQNGKKAESEKIKNDIAKFLAEGDSIEIVESSSNNQHPRTIHTYLIESSKIRSITKNGVEFFLLKDLCAYMNRDTIFLITRIKSNARHIELLRTHSAQCEVVVSSIQPIRAALENIKKHSRTNKNKVTRLLSFFDKKRNT